MDNDFEFDFSRFETPDSPESASVDTHYSYVRNSRKSYTTSRDSTVPQPEPRRKPYTEEDRVRKEPKKAEKTKAPEAAKPSVKNRPSEDRRPGLLQLGIRVLATAFFVAGLAVLIGGLVTRYSVSRQIYNMNTKIATAKSETVRLTNELSGITTVSAIDNYATNVLGMVKVETYQQNYVSFDDGDEVILTTGGKLKGFASSILSKTRSDSENSDDTSAAADADTPADVNTQTADNVSTDGSK